MTETASTPPESYSARLPIQFDEQSGTIMGVPIYTSEHLSRGEVLQGNLDGKGESVHVHPQTFHALRIALSGDRPLSDPHVQLDASLAWIGERIERRARVAEKRLAMMVSGYAERDRARDLINTPCPFYGAHDWEPDHMRRTSKCLDCGLTVTDEMFARAAA